MLRKIVFLLCATSAVLAIPRPDVSKGEIKADVDVCSLPPVNPSPVACSGLIPRWTYNAKAGVCEKYTYGGCFGTENLFKNEFACLAKCNKEGLEKKISEIDATAPCMQPKATGNCRAFIPSFFFDTQTGLCTSFTYTGCGGNDNNFNTEDECDLKCNGLQGPVKPPAAADDSAASLAAAEKELTKQEKCSLPPVKPSPFSCLAFIPSWTFNSTTGECQSYVYGGCGKTANLYNSQDECNIACGPEPSVILPTEPSELMKPDSKCTLPPVTPSPISCLAAIPSWTFNSTAGKCESYMYGGCGKTANMFSSQDDCNAACGPKPRILQPRQEICQLPVVKGPCFALWKRFAFVKEKNRCELFYFGGCQGNRNNFRTADDCYKTCGGDEPNTTPECSEVKCPVSNKRFIERGCRPEYKGKACCPTRFVCPEEKSVEGVCRYRDVSYLIGQEITQLNQDDACKTGCTCEASENHRGGAKIKCNQIYCDEPFRPQQEGCVLVTPPGACCPSYKCPEKRPEQEGPRDDICVFNGKEYLKGQSIPSGQPCKWCTCVDGFNGLEGPGCRDAHCVVDNRIGCVPVYAPGVCCPISYKCISAAELKENKTRIIQIQPEAGKQGVTTLPMELGKARSVVTPNVSGDLCFLPKVIGPCKMSRPSFHFDAIKGDCLPFLYGGCKGNENRFETLEACLDTCSSVAISPGTRIIRIEPQTGHQGVTTLPFNLGSAEDSPSGAINVQPEPGKKGVSTLPIALSRSGNAQQESSARTRPSVCLQPKVTGPCRGLETNYFFDSTKEKCVAFNYGGCEGNDNRFETLEKCRQVCGEIVNEPVDQFARCKLPADVGMCRGFAQRFFYDGADQECKPFTYGGCLGNANNFASQEECLSACAPPVIDAKARARARARARSGIPVDEEPVTTNVVDTSAEGTCKFGNLTVKVGERLVDSETPCEECHCSTPPELTCVTQSCPPPPMVDSAICQPEFVDGQCCPNYSCVSANPPSINVCEGVKCEEEEHCEVQSQESVDGEWLPPIGVCMKNAMLADDAAGETTEFTTESLATVSPVKTNKCAKESCPPPPLLGSAICRPVNIPGQCCPSYSCVSANPPSINVCEEVICDEDEHCEVQAQESQDGSWLPPIGVCITDSTSIPL